MSGVSATPEPPTRDTPSVSDTQFQYPEVMTLVSMRRAMRKVDWLVRCIVLLLAGGCLTTLFSWAWSNNLPGYSFRQELELPGHYVSLANNFQLLSDPSFICPSCPEPLLDQLPEGLSPADLQKINCTINEVHVIECRQDKGGEVFMPVSFINEYFEVFGNLKRDGATRHYHFQHSYGKIYPVQPVYHPGGVFLNFEKYFVESRDKIICVTASEGVPLVSQWDPAGYYYAITVAQYGLSHHAKGILEGNPVPRPVAGGQMNPADWELTGPDMSVQVVDAPTPAGARKVVSFNSPESLTAAGPVLKLGTTDQALVLDLLLNGTGGLTVKIKTKEGNLGFIHYTVDDAYMVVNGSHVILGMGQRQRGKWVHLARDIYTDWLKSLGRVKFTSPTLFMEIVDVTLHGSGMLDNVTVAASAHNEHLIQAADWLVNHQDSMGGWPTSIGMKTGDNIQLKPGWYSAMGQGQAMSTLVRAFNLTGQQHYVETAVKGLHLYELGSEEGGVRARFLGHLDWYEEYPTTPTSTFVLNGFIFSMLGLYDTMKTADGAGQLLAEKLWSAGLHSLKIMLGMYDSGSGTLYDLRHIVCHEQPNRARWDYHTTHIALIEEMAIIEGDPLFHTTLHRWIDYFNGKKSRHN